MQQAELKQTIYDRLSQVIDPETGVDVMRMKLVRDLVVSEDRKVSYTFRPSSPFCPIAVPLAMDIIKAVEDIEWVTGQSIKVVDYIEADKLNDLFRSILE
ncbi:MAG: iron-sulfur cluster assembly protein [Anaerolineaceae bacterium]